MEWIYLPLRQVGGSSFPFPPRVDIGKSTLLWVVGQPKNRGMGRVIGRDFCLPGRVAAEGFRACGLHSATAWYRLRCGAVEYPPPLPGEKKEGPEREGCKDAAKSVLAPLPPRAPHSESREEGIRRPARREADGAKPGSAVCAIRPGA
jgi:hypothetical protein